MLPCQTTCSEFQCGCHKTCLRWKTFQDEQRDQCRAKKQYLRFYGALCAQVARQYKSMQARRPVR